jgi:hypothetical protein
MDLSWSGEINLQVLGCIDDGLHWIVSITGSFGAFNLGRFVEGEPVAGAVVAVFTLIFINVLLARSATKCLTVVVYSEGETVGILSISIVLSQN